MQDKQCNECQNEDENETLYWDNELDKPNMVDYTCLCEPCFIKINKGRGGKYVLSNIKTEI